MASLGTWPASIVPASLRMVLHTNQRANAAPGGGSEQVIDMLNDRWMAELTLPVEKFADAAAVEAFLASFRGHVNTVNLWHFARSAPRGTLRGSLVLSAAASQGAASIQVQAQRGRVNLLTYSEQLDNAAWTKTSVSVTANATTAPDGTNTAEKLVESAALSHHGVTQPITPSSVFPYTGSVHVKAAERGYAFVGFNGGGIIAYASVNLATGAVSTATGSLTVTAEDKGAGWWRVKITANTTSTAAMQLDARVSTDGVWANRSYTGDGSSGIYTWGAQLEQADTASAYQRIADAATFDVADYAQAGKTILAGDLLGVGGLLLMASQDATASASAIATVQLVNRLRVAQSLGAAVTWDKPTASFRKLSDTGVLYRQGLADEISLTLGEAIA